MQFDSYIYALFLPLVFSLYWILVKHLKWKNAMLLVAWRIVDFLVVGCVVWIDHVAWRFYQEPQGSGHCNMA